MTFADSVLSLIIDDSAHTWPACMESKVTVRYATIAKSVLISQSKSSRFFFLAFRNHFLSHSTLRFTVGKSICSSIDKENGL